MNRRLLLQCDSICNCKLARHWFKTVSWPIVQPVRSRRGLGRKEIEAAVRRKGEGSGRAELKLEVLLYEATQAFAVFVLHVDKFDATATGA